MKILLFGKSGQVGWELNRSLLPLGDVVAFGREDVDLSVPEALRKTVREIKPDIIINAAAYTAVDRAEEEEELATIINGVAPGVLAEEAITINALLVHYSTDYVFDGTKDTPYVETDDTNPVNAYGRSKLAGEQSIQSSKCNYLIFRTSWVYAARGHNFLLSILKLAKDRDELSIVSDQTGSPTSARLIAETSVLCIHQAMMRIQKEKFYSDLYHLSASGFTNWHEFACAIINMSNEKCRLKLACEMIKAISSQEYRTPARRPLNSRLVLNKLEADYHVVMPYWKSGLQLCIEEISED